MQPLRCVLHLSLRDLCQQSEISQNKTEEYIIFIAQYTP